MWRLGEGEGGGEGRGEEGGRKDRKGGRGWGGVGSVTRKTAAGTLARSGRVGAGTVLAVTLVSPLRGKRVLVTSPLRRPVELFRTGHSLRQVAAADDVVPDFSGNAEPTNAGIDERTDDRTRTVRWCQCGYDAGLQSAAQSHTHTTRLSVFG